jgi:hypothetical protein
MQLRSAGALLALAAVAITVGAAAARAPVPSPLDRLDWLSGCLEMRKGDLLVEEQRMRARGASMLGMSRTTSGKGLLEYELTLIKDVDGRLVYEAHPSGQAMTVFPAVSATDDSVLFSAPEHDYPQFVGYRKVGADSVIAWIDGKSRGKQRRVEFSYRRVACGSDG